MKQKLVDRLRPPPRAEGPRLRRAADRDRPGRHPPDEADDRAPARAAGAAVIVSSHLLPLVEEICDRVLILSKGRAVLAGTLEEIRAAGGSDASLEDVFLRVTETGA